MLIRIGGMKARNLPRFVGAILWCTLCIKSTVLADPSEAEALEAQLQAVQAQMLALQAQMDSLQAQISLIQEPVSTELTPAVEAKPERMRENPRPSAESRYGIRLYGKIKIDGIYDTNNLGSSEFITYIPKGAEGTGQVSFTARETRFGMALGGPKIGDWAVTGKLETDFYGSAPSGGSGSLRMRLAYADFSNGNQGVRVGQDWLPVAGVNPTTLNFTILGYNGNLWNRVPQITYRRHLAGNWSGLVTAYRCRDNEDDEHGLNCDLKLPWFGTKIAYEGSILNSSKPAYFGLSGAIRNGEVNGQSVTPHLLAAEWKIPVAALELRGEAYFGEGLGAEYLHRGGAFNLAGTPIQTVGGMLQLGYQAAPSLNLNLGYGFDNPRDSDILADEFYSKNSTLYGNAIYSLAEGLSVGVEGSQVQTKYSELTLDGFRFQSALIYLW